MKIGSATSSPATASAQPATSSAAAARLMPSHAVPSTHAPDAARQAKAAAQSAMGQAIGRGRLLDVRA